MPVAPTYPGVYIEEIPSGVRTITGVATSITAFIGRTLRGSVNEPVTINGFGDFERRFGGLCADYPLGYAVRDFFLNGGAQALIVRLFEGTPDNAVAKLNVGGLKLRAASPGLWGDKLRGVVGEVSDDVKAQLGLAGKEVFNLTVRDTSPAGASETFVNLTVEDGPRRADQVLADQSNLVLWDGAWPNTAPTITPGKDDASKADDAVSPKAKAYVDARNALADAENATYADQNAHDAAVAAATTARDLAKKALDDATKAVSSAENTMKGADSAALTSATYLGSSDNKTGLNALLKADLFNLLCIPPDTRGASTPAAVYQAAMSFCADHRAVLLVDSPATWSANKETAADTAKKGLDGLGLSGQSARNAALYFPRVEEADPLRGGQLDTFVPCGIVAGIAARTDVARGVWKAPAGLDASLNGTLGLDVNLNDLENGTLNQLGINCLRSFPVSGRVVWGARTLRGADQLADEYKYLPVRRLALYIEESLFRGLKWVVFEPNDEPLWAQIRLNVGAFMQNLFRQGAFQGASQRDAYFVKCDRDTTTQNDINLGIVNIVVGFAPLKPAEFVIVKLQQMAGQIQT